MATVLVVDDDPDFRAGLAEALADLGHDVLAAGAPAEALAALAGPAGRMVDAALLDLRMPGGDGLGLLRRLRGPGGRSPPFPVVILTAYASSANTIEAMRLGAFDHLVKPIGRDDLRAMLDRMLASGSGRAAAGAGRPEEDEGPLLGRGPAMREVQKLVGRAADSDATVLVTGETGTGKELVARALHGCGRRAGRPFVAVNCAAIPAELLESELFGHARGAFTGAVADRPGRFREAEGGTLLLDEVGDMDLAMQAKVLRAIQERTVTPVGGAPRAVDARIVAATHRDLPALVREGRFREDLYYRLNVIPIHLPPLRDRPEDVVPLAERFLAEAAGAGGPKRLSEAAAARLRSHAWPGNVRELRNLMERLAVLVPGAVIDAGDVELAADPAPPAGEAVGGGGGEAVDLPAAVERLERGLIARALRLAGGNRAEAARRLGINRQLLYEKLRRYGL